MSAAKPGDTVKVHYTGRLDDGTVFDSSEGRSPLEFVLGTGHVIPGFEKAVEGLSEGERTTTQIPPEEAYGPHSDERVIKVPRDRFPDSTEPKVGQHFEMQAGDGERVPVTVTSIDEGDVELDANHPLAGERLTFELEVVGVDPG